MNAYMSTTGRFLYQAPTKDVQKEFVQGTMNKNKISCNPSFRFSNFLYDLSSMVNLIYFFCYKRGMVNLI